MSYLDELFPVIGYDPAMQAEPEPWFVEGLWMAQKINALLGAEKSGKSRLLAWVLAGMYARRPVLGMKHETRAKAPGSWLYLAGEEKIATVVTRLRQYLGVLGADPDLPLPIKFIEAAGMKLETDQYQSWIENVVEREESEGVIIEPLARVHTANEKDNWEMAKLDTAFRKWSNRDGRTLIVVHHTGKLHPDADMQRIGTWSRGATDLATIVDTAAFVKPTGLSVDGTRYLQLIRAGRFEPLLPLSILDRKDTGGFTLA